MKILHLLSMHKRSYYLVNGITFYRLIATPFLLFLVFNKNLEVFKWMLAVSFFTDAVDGFMARRLKVTSVFGSKLDSVADDLTLLVAVIGMFVFNREFLLQQLIVILILLALFLIQVSLAFSRYGKMTAFHTYGAKIATILQGVFMLLFFFLPEPSATLFYITAIVTGLELMEEIIIILLLPEWRTDVKGLYWVLKKKKHGGKFMQ